MILISWIHICVLGLPSVIFVVPISTLQISQAVKTEVCSHETYSSQCQYDEILVITKAIYGHIRQGRCAERDFGHFGCFTDVTSYMDSECSSQRSCTLSMSDVIDNNVLPDCARGLVAFMDVTHVCINGQPLQDVCRTVTATASEKFFFSKQAMQEKCPSPGYVSLEAKPGQQIQVKIVIPTDNYNHQNVGGIVEDGVEQAYTMSTNTDGRLEGLYSSKTHLITIVIGNAGQTHIVVFQANGCTDIESPHNAVIERNGDSLIVKCRYTEQVWNLKCIGTRWIGAVGTCKVPTKPPVIVLPKENEENIDEMIPHPRIISKELIIGIIVSATLVLCCIVFSVGYLCAKGMKRKYLSNKDYEKSEMVAVDGTIARMMKADNVHVWQNTMNPTMTRNDHVPVVAMDRDFITVNTNNL